jgi:hypothetical protein
VLRHGSLPRQSKRLAQRLSGLTVPSSPASGISFEQALQVWYVISFNITSLFVSIQLSAISYQYAPYIAILPDL